MMSKTQYREGDVVLYMGDPTERRVLVENGAITGNVVVAFGLVSKACHHEALTLLRRPVLCGDVLCSAVGDDCGLNWAVVEAPLGSSVGVRVFGCGALQYLDLGTLVHLDGTLIEPPAKPSVHIDVVDDGAPIQVIIGTRPEVPAYLDKFPPCPPPHVHVVKRDPVTVSDDVMSRAMAEADAVLRKAIIDQTEMALDLRVGSCARTIADLREVIARHIPAWLTVETACVAVLGWQDLARKLFNRDPLVRAYVETRADARCTQHVSSESRLQSEGRPWTLTVHHAVEDPSKFARAMDVCWERDDGQHRSRCVALAKDVVAALGGGQ